MVFDPRDQLWEKTFQTYYDTYYEEVLAEKLIRRWQLVDEITKVLVALTVSGSAVSGWALWTTPQFKTGWAILAGIAAVLSIVNIALVVPNRLNEWNESKRAFSRLRVDLETLRYRMELDTDFSVEDFTTIFLAYRERYAECIQTRKEDILSTDRLRNKAQDELDTRVTEEIVQQVGTQGNGKETEEGRTAAGTTETTPSSERGSETQEEIIG